MESRVSAEPSRPGARGTRLSNYSLYGGMGGASNGKETPEKILQKLSLDWYLVSEIHSTDGYTKTTRHQNTRMLSFDEALLMCPSYKCADYGRLFHSGHSGDYGRLDSPF